MEKNGRAAAHGGESGEEQAQEGARSGSEGGRPINLGSVLVRGVAPVCLIGTLALIAVKLIAGTSWPWALVLAPLTAAGVLFTVVAAAEVGLRLWSRFRGEIDPDDLTPPPERLERPRNAAAVGDRILEDQPEILAAICHGFRVKKLLPSVLGETVSDPWGIYRAAIDASEAEIQQLYEAAHLHTRHMAQTARTKRGKGPVPSDGKVLKNAVRAFGRCAARTESGRGNPDCTFEHVVAVFGARTPARDRHLKTMAPRIRRLLERQYPQLSTAELADGSAVKYEKWKEQATRDREEIDHLRRALDRTERKLDEARTEIEEARAETEELRGSVGREHERARREAREQQAEVVQELRESLVERRAEHDREVARLEGRIQRLKAAIGQLELEQERLEHALFDHDEAPDEDEVDLSVLNGARVILVGGDSGQLRPIREHLESNGVQLVHEDREGATDLVANAHVVAIWIIQVSHPTMYAVRRECRVTGVPCVYWSRSSPESLGKLLAGALGSSPVAVEPTSHA